MSIQTGQNIIASDFINKGEKNATPANDEGRGVKLEADGNLHPFFTKNGLVGIAGGTINGGTLPVPVYLNKTYEDLRPCDANDSDTYKFIGFAISNATNATPIDFQGSGVVKGFSGLLPGEKYYVQDTAGTIGTSPGTHAILVGIAVSDTELLIQKGTHRAAGSSTFATTSSGSEAITLGFRPAKIIIKATMVNDEYYSTLNLIWQNGSTKALLATTDPGGNAAVDTNPYLFSNGVLNAYHLFAITSVTDTGFTILRTKVGSVSNYDAGYIWEAEGEL